MADSNLSLRATVAFERLAERSNQNAGLIVFLFVVWLIAHWLGAQVLGFMLTATAVNICMLNSGSVLAHQPLCRA